MVYLAYFSIYASAIALASPFTLPWVLLSALASSLPEGVVAPWVLSRVHRAAENRGRRPILGLVGLGVAFVVWSSTASFAALLVVRRLHDGSWQIGPVAPSLAWRGFLALLVYGCLVGAGLALAGARAAAQARARAEIAERLRAEARLQVLRANLNPHFVLNVLHSLVGLAERDPKLTAQALERLGSTLRFALRLQARGTDRVSLGEELALVRDTLALERLRLGARLRDRFDVPEELLTVAVPTFTLQPLIENALRHAIAPRSSGGRLEVTARASAEGLVLTVDDDGDSIASPPGAAAATSGEGLGLALLRDRLQTLYGDRARLDTGPSPLGGFRATVTLDPRAPTPEDEA